MKQSHRTTCLLLSVIMLAVLTSCNHKKVSSGSPESTTTAATWDSTTSMTDGTTGNSMDTTEGTGSPAATGGIQTGGATTGGAATTATKAATLTARATVPYTGKKTGVLSQEIIKKITSSYFQPLEKKVR